MPWECDFATITSDKELVVHLAAVHQGHPFPDELSIGWLCQRLHLIEEEVFDALLRSGNGAFLDLLYAAMFKLFPEVPASPPDVTVLGAPSLKDNSAIAGPDPKTATEIEQLGYLSLLRTKVHPLRLWPLPAADLFVPLPEIVTEQLKTSSKKDEQASKCYELTPLTPDTNILGELKQRVRALRATIEVATQDHQRDHSRVVVLAKVRSLLELEAHHWRNVKSILTAPADALQALDRLDVAVVDVMREAIEVLAERTGQAKAADRLMALFDPAKEGSKVQFVLKTLAKHPGAYPQDFVDEFFEQLTLSFHMLGQSELKLEFIRDHWLPLVKAACQEVPRSVTDVFEEVGDLAFSTVWDEGWNDDLGLLEVAVGVPGRVTSLKPLLNVAKGSKLAMGVISAGASDLLILALLKRVEFVFTAASSKPASRIMASVMLRFLAAGAIQHQIAGTPMLSRTASLKQFLNAIRTAKAADASGWFKIGEEFNKKFDLSGRFSRWQAGVGVTTVAAFTMMAFAILDDDASPVQRATGFAAGALSGAGVAIGKTEAAAVIAGNEVAAKKFGMYGKAVSAAAAVLGVWVAARATRVAWKVGDTYGAATNAIATMSAGLTLAGTVAAASYIGAAATGWGIALGAVALSMAVLGPGTGPASLVRAYWRYAKQRSGPVAEVSATKLAALESAITLAAPILVDLEGGIGLRGDKLAMFDRPTVHAAHSMGFETPELITMFEDGEDLLAGKGFEHPPYKRTIR